MISWKQIFVLVLCVFLLIGFSYSNDWPQALQTPLREQPFNFTSFQYNLLYLVTNLPIAVLNIPFGMLLDAVPIKIALIGVPFIGFLSQTATTVLFSFHTSQHFYPLLLASRAIFGFSGQGGYTLQAIVFHRLGKRRSFDALMGLGITIPFLFSAVQSLVTTHLYEAQKSMPIPLIVCSAMCLLSVFAGLLLIWFIGAAAPEQLKHAQEMQSESDSGEVEAEQFNCNEVKKFDGHFWLLVLLTFLLECGLEPFLDNQNDLLVKRFHIPYSTVGILMMLPLGLTPFLSIFWSQVILIKYPNQRRSFFILISSMACLVHLMLYFLPNTNNPGALHYIIISFNLGLFSLAFSGFFTVIISSVCFLVPKKAVGTAYGIQGSGESLAQAAMPLINTFVVGESGKLAITYGHLSLVYAGICMAGLLITITMKVKNTPILVSLDKKIVETSQQLQERVEQLKAQKHTGLVDALENLLTNDEKQQTQKA